MIFQGGTASITAGTTQTQAGATLCTGDLNKVLVTTANDGVILPAAIAGAEITIANLDGSDALKVYPDTGGKINQGSANASVTQNALKTIKYKCAVGSQGGVSEWFSTAPLT